MVTASRPLAPTAERREAVEFAGVVVVAQWVAAEEAWSAAVDRPAVAFRSAVVACRSAVVDSEEAASVVAEEVVVPRAVPTVAASTAAAWPRHHLITVLLAQADFACRLFLSPD